MSVKGTVTSSAASARMVWVAAPTSDRNTMISSGPRSARVSSVVSIMPRLVASVTLADRSTAKSTVALCRKAVILSLKVVAVDDRTTADTTSEAPNARSSSRAFVSFTPVTKAVVPDSPRARRS